jgi:hypothetical protein
LAVLYEFRSAMGILTEGRNYQADQHNLQPPFSRTVATASSRDREGT